MCGIVGVASPGPMSVQMQEFFQSLLFHDVVRGHHATGVAAIDTLSRDLTVEKKAVAAPEFLQDKEMMENLFAFKHNFNIYIGHNRWATSGAKDADDNAHPFIHGDIVGVHNGSLRNQRLLDDNKDFVVDSDNLYYHLSRNGLADTVTKTDGAYALCWYDKSDNTLNFIHNGERPLSLGKLTNGCYVWASELGMLRWLVGRHKTLAFDTYMESGVRLQNVYNVAKNTHVKVKFKDKTRQFDGEYDVQEYTPPVFPSRTSWTSDDYYGNRSYSNSDNRIRPRNGVTYETGAVKAAKDAIGMALVGAKVGESVLECKFLGNVKSKVPGGSYLATLSLFEYRSKNGVRLVLHSFVYTNSICENWGDDEVGKVVYCTLGNIVAHHNATYPDIRNENIGHSICGTHITEKKPNKLYPYHEEGESQNVLPFRERETSQQESQASPSSTTGQSQHGASSDDVNALPAQLRIQLANGFCSRSQFVSMVAENHNCCACCGHKLTEIVSSRIWLFEHFDRGEAATFNYLMCRKLCYSDMKEVCESIDSDFDKVYGGNHD